MRILVTGAGGQLGRAIVAEAPEGMTVHALSRCQLDITDPAAVAGVLEAVRPDWVVNTAAYTAVDRAEAQPDRAFAVNRDGARIVAEACRRFGCRMLHLSTDYVFDGKRGTPYRPEDPPCPVNTYGRSKWAGEKAVRSVLGARALILRTAWVYSVKGPSFLTTVLGLLREREELRVVEDQVGTPTSALSLARAVLRAVERGVGGIHHWTDAGVASWYDFAVAIAEEAASRGLLRRIPRIRPVPAREYSTAAPRPAYSVLDKDSARRVLELEPVHWRRALGEALNLARR